MADELYLNLWFPSFEENQIMPRLLSVLKQFPASSTLPGVGYVSVRPIDWNEATVFEQRFDFRADPAEAIEVISEYLHDDYAYEVEMAWDIWAPQPSETPGEEDAYGPWQVQAQPVIFTGHGKQFAGGAHQEDGHIQVDFGLDTPFLHEELDYTPETERRVKANVQKLIDFTQRVEKNCGISGRVLWSESDENLAQKLIAKLQRIN
jgi:hypothetical protein